MIEEQLIPYVLTTGQTGCFDAQGRPVPCAGSGQDGELVLGDRGLEPRFATLRTGEVLDRTTGLRWPQKGLSFDFALRWEEALDHVRELNRSGYLEHDDWRLPNRRELRSLISHGHSRPALPAGHPFTHVEQTWYWTSTSSAMYPGHAWAMHMAGGRMFWNRKDQISMVWPVRGRSAILPATGQEACFDGQGRLVPCAGSGQDGEFLAGAVWPVPRFAWDEGDVLDRMTGLLWRELSPAGDGLATWEEALLAVRALDSRPGWIWHLPNINELESLVDADRASPALPRGHLFSRVPEVLWSSTNSGFEPDWAYALYAHKGAVGVGFKQTARFGVWAAGIRTQGSGS